MRKALGGLGRASGCMKVPQEGREPDHKAAARDLELADKADAHREPLLGLEDRGRQRMEEILRAAVRDAVKMSLDTRPQVQQESHGAVRTTFERHDSIHQADLDGMPAKWYHGSESTQEPPSYILIVQNGDTANAYKERQDGSLQLVERREWEVLSPGFEFGAIGSNVDLHVVWFLQSDGIRNLRGTLTHVATREREIPESFSGINSSDSVNVDDGYGFPGLRREGTGCGSLCSSPLSSKKKDGVADHFGSRSRAARNDADHSDFDGVSAEQRRERFGDFKWAKPSVWVTGQPHLNSMMVCIHLLAACSFVGHAVSLLCCTEWERLELSENILAACLFVIVGIVFPCMAHWVARHDSLKEIMTVANSFDSSITGRDSRFLFIASFALPLLVAVGTIAPVALWVPQASAIGKFIPASGVLVLSTTMCWAWGMLLFGPAKVEEVGLQVVEGVIGALTMRVEYAGRIEHDLWKWRAVARQVRYVDRLLSDLFSWKALGGLWSVRIAALFSMALLLGSISVVHPHRSMQYACMVAAVLSSLAATILLLRLARLTTMCCSSEPANRSVRSVLYVGLVDFRLQLRQDEEHARSMLHHYLSDRRMGIRLFGVLITTDLVLITGLRTCVYIPVAVTLICRVLHD